MPITSFVNPYSYWVLRKHDKFLSDPRINYEYDGISLCLLARLIGKNKKRKSFDDTSLAPIVFRDAILCEKKIALVGSKPGITHEAAKILIKRYPGLLIDFTQHGYMNADERREVLDRCSNLDVVICSMGTPHQESFLLDLLGKGWAGMGYTCGGYLDQLVSSRGGNYYPTWANALHMRWLYRIFREPRRLIVRYMVIYPIGCFYFLADGWRGSSH